MDTICRSQLVCTDLCRQQLIELNFNQVCTVHNATLSASLPLPHHTLTPDSLGAFLLGNSESLYIYSINGIPWAKWKWLYLPFQIRTDPIHRVHAYPDRWFNYQCIGWLEDMGPKPVWSLQLQPVEVRIESESDWLAEVSDCEYDYECDCESLTQWLTVTECEYDSDSVTEEVSVWTDWMIHTHDSVFKFKIIDYLLIEFESKFAWVTFPLTQIKFTHLHHHIMFTRLLRAVCWVYLKQ